MSEHFDFATIRRSMNFTQAGIAEQLGVSKRAVEQWEAGTNPVPVSIRMAIHFISMDYAATTGFTNKLTAKAREIADALSEQLSKGPNVDFIREVVAQSTAAGIYGQGRGATMNIPDFYELFDQWYETRNSRGS